MNKSHLQMAVQNGLTVRPNPLPMGLKYHVCAVYNQEKDLLQVQTLLQPLTNSGFSVFDPCVDLIGGQSKIGAMNKGLDSSKTTVIFLTKNFKSDEMCRFEIKNAIWRHNSTRGKHRVLTIVLEPCKIPRCLKLVEKIHLWKNKDKGLHEKVNQIMKKLSAKKYPFRKLRWIGTKSVKTVHDMGRWIPDTDKTLGSLNLLLKLNLVQTALQNGILHCKNKKCKFACQGVDFQRYIGHIKDCPHKVVQCGNKGCLLNGPREVVMRHGELCEYRCVTCKHKGCGMQVSQKMLPDHETECSYGIDKCPNSGCPVNLPKKDIKEHLKVCGYTKQLCTKCNITFFMMDLPLHTCKTCFCGRFISEEHLQSHIQTCKGANQNVRCPNDHCLKELPQEKMNQHLNECPHIIIRCHYVGCMYEDKRDSVIRHIELCKYRPEKCLSCGMLMPHKDLNWHYRICDRLVECKVCGAQVPSSMKLTHDTWLCKKHNIHSFCKFCENTMAMSNYDDHIHQCEATLSVTSGIGSGAMAESNMGTFFSDNMMRNIDNSSGLYGERLNHAVGSKEAKDCKRKITKAQVSVEDILVGLSVPTLKNIGKGNINSYDSDLPTYNGHKKYPTSFSKLREIYKVIERNVPILKEVQSTDLKSAV
ncbi:hypothetical protein CHS0354_026763 [Potamilus streckersoni]|uniref:Uncharacterized protein n=1 Tax=Potamilus streckersoni TaxID=2493646 RepID=A0AAE0VSF0_9BIVA|nr:hypothetical protein CHS0354_026763 [Potamilus streckersoni]